jgi:capsular exopolysaccharide synthesis family protein
VENFLQEEVNNQKISVSNLQDNLVEHHILTRDLQTNVLLYEALLSRMKEASVASTMVSSNVAVTQEAALPFYPASPKKLLYMVVAMIVGMTCALGAVFLAEYLDDSIKTTEEMEKFCRIASLGVVPFLPRKEGELRNEESSEMGMITYSDPKSLFSEAIHHVNTSIALTLSGGPPQVIMVTSANPSEGKSTLCLNLALSLSLGDHKVVIVDADMRKPVINKILKQPLIPGLSTFLSGSASQADIIHPTEVPNLFCIPAGAAPPSPIQLLNSGIFSELITSLRKDFRYLLIDTPPIIGFADGRTISPKVDGVILIIKHHSTSRDAARLASQLLVQINAPLLGVVCNMTKSYKLGYGGYYDYYRYYSKSYKQYHNDN